jgi:hypothetical protein
MCCSICSRRPSASRQTGDNSGQVVRVNRLGDVDLKAGEKRLPLVLLVHERGQRHDAPIPTMGNDASPPDLPSARAASFASVVD